MASRLAPSPMDSALKMHTKRCPDRGSRDSSTCRRHGDSQPVMGRSTHPRRTRQARARRLRTHGVETLSASAPSAVTNVADVPQQSPGHHGVDGFFTVSTLTGRVLFVLVLLSHERHVSCMSTSPSTRRPPGRRSRWSTRFLRTWRHTGCSEIATASTARRRKDIVSS